MTERDEPYTLDVDEAADAYADLMAVRLGAPRTESIATFRRMIEAVRAEAIRTALDGTVLSCGDSGVRVWDSREHYDAGMPWPLPIREWLDRKAKGDES